MASIDSDSESSHKKGPGVKKAKKAFHQCGHDPNG
jgi:hypothetical protein